MNCCAQAISPSDYEEAVRFFAEDGVAPERIRFTFHRMDKRWELRDAADDSLVARREAPPASIIWARA